MLVTYQKLCLYLSTSSLFDDTVTSSDSISLNNWMLWMTEGKDVERNRIWLILTYSPGICLVLQNSLCKVKVTLVQALRLCTGLTAQRRSRGIALPFHDHDTRRDEGSTSRPGRSLPSGKNRYQLYRRPVWTGAENLAPPGFDPRTLQPVARYYTDWAIAPHLTYTIFCCIFS